MDLPSRRCKRHWWARVGPIWRPERSGSQPREAGPRNSASRRNHPRKLTGAPSGGSRPGSKQSLRLPCKDSQSETCARERVRTSQENSSRPRGSRVCREPLPTAVAPGLVPGARGAPHPCRATHTAWRYPEFRATTPQSMNHLDSTGSFSPASKAGSPSRNAAMTSISTGFGRYFFNGPLDNTRRQQAYLPGDGQRCEPDLGAL